MKLKYLLMGALVGVAFTACTNDDEPAVKNPVVDASGDQFMAVNFTMSGEATTRAWDDVFEYGEADANELVVKKATFFFMKGGVQVADPYEINVGDLDVSQLQDVFKFTVSDADPAINIEQISNVIVVMKNPIDVPENLIVILNANLSDLSLSKTSTLAQIKAAAADYETNFIGKDGFLMTNSIYLDIADQVGTTIAKVFNTAEEAKNATGNDITVVHVERVVAKVRVAESENLVVNSANTENASNTVVVNGAEMTITPEILGWWLDDKPSKTYLVKSLADSYTVGDVDLPTSWYDDADNFRSYWATMPSVTFAHQTFGDAATNDMYTMENTSVSNPITLVVAATLKSGDDAVNLVKFNGELYTEDGFKTGIINILAHKYWTSTTGGDGKVTYNTVSSNEIIFGDPVTSVTDIDPETDGVQTAGIEQYQAIFTPKVKEGVTLLVQKADGSYEDADETVLAKDLADLTRTVQYWNSGKTYYFVPIKHYAVGDTDIYGVIRNHLYDITINSINGLGTPVPFSDTDEIDPIIPSDENSYISAQIKILSYKVVTQNVDLGK